MRSSPTGEVRANSFQHSRPKLCIIGSTESTFTLSDLIFPCFAGSKLMSSNTAFPPLPSLEFKIGVSSLQCKQVTPLLWITGCLIIQKSPMNGSRLPIIVECNHGSKMVNNEIWGSLITFDISIGKELDHVHEQANLNFLLLSG